VCQLVHASPTLERSLPNHVRLLGIAARDVAGLPRRLTERFSRLGTSTHGRSIPERRRRVRLSDLAGSKALVGTALPRERQRLV
jgi:hypothetical protein